MVPLDCDLACLDPFEEFFLQDFFRSQGVAPMHQGDVGAYIRQVQGFLHRRVTAANHCHRLVTIKKTITGRAGTHALTHESLFRIQPQILGGRTGGNDQGVTAIGIAVALQAERLLAQVYTIDIVKNYFGIKPLCMAFHSFHELRALQTLDITGPVVHIRGGG